MADWHEELAALAERKPAAPGLPLSGAVRSGDDVLTLWPRGTDPTAHREAFDAIDPERVSSATGILNAFRAKADAITADGELSEVGKSTRIAEAASSALHNVSRAAREVEGLEAAYRKEAEAAIVIPKADVTDTLFDIELARMARAEGKIPTLLENSSERMRLALVRAPVELSGIKPEVRERLRGSFVDHATALRLEQRSSAITAARTGVQRALELISRHATEMTPKQKAALVPNGWNTDGFSRKSL